jgi:antirestriction protein ArdC
LKAYWVFNASQIDGIDIVPADTVEKPVTSIELAETSIVKTGAALSHGGDAAF